LGVWGGFWNLPAGTLDEQPGSYIQKTGFGRFLRPDLSAQQNDAVHFRNLSGLNFDFGYIYHCIKTMEKEIKN
jgi:hypothetical protein